MRKLILATIGLVALAGPALADMTLPAGDYPQARGSAWSTTEAGPAAFNATVEREPAHIYTGRSASGHTRTQHALPR